MLLLSGMSNLIVNYLFGNESSTVSAWNWVTEGTLGKIEQSKGYRAIV